MKEYRVGMIGFGFIGKVHAYGYRNLAFHYRPVPLKARITHVCTSRPETAEEGCRLVGAEHATTDYRRITENPEIDIVHVCTPNHLHRDALLSAIAHGKHIYCEKPLTATLPEAEEIGRALTGYRGTAQMVLQNRFFPATMRARQLVRQGALGEILEYRCAYLHSGSADPRAPLKWKLSAEAGGGVIADLGSHAFDLVDFLVGEFEEVQAAVRIAYPERPAAHDPSRTVRVQAEDCVMILARMKNGALGHIEATKIATGAEDELRLEIHGSRGALRFNGMDPHHLEFYDRTAPAAPIGGTRGWIRIDTGQRYPEPANGFPTPKAAIGWIRSHMACLAHFLRAVADGEPGDPGLDQGIAVQRVMDACRRAADRGGWVRV